MPHPRRYDRGFTLVELSIVLVIIGLLFGAVLVGRDLIHEAEIRATLRQIDSYKTAVNTFRLKFNALPGDMLPTDAAQYGFYVMQDDPGGPYNGNNNGQLIGSTADGESIIFWRHLSDANLIAGTFGPAFRPTDEPALCALVSAYLPVSKLGAHAYVYAHYDSYLKTNVYVLFTPYQPNFNTVALPPGPSTICGSWARTAVTPAESYAMDKKVDDGMPNSGTVSRNSSVPYSPWAATAADGNCTFGGSFDLDPSGTYNTAPATGGDTRSCSLGFKF